MNLRTLIEINIKLLASSRNHSRNTSLIQLLNAFAGSIYFQMLFQLIMHESSLKYYQSIRKATLQRYLIGLTSFSLMFAPSMNNWQQPVIIVLLNPLKMHQSHLKKSNRNK